MTRAESLYNRLSPQFAGFLKEHSKRCTTERMTILRYCCNQRKRITYAYLRACAEIDHICLQSIYNTMELLAKANIVVREQDNGTPIPSFAVQMEKRNTIRLICTKCKRVEDFKDKLVYDRLKLRKYRNFNIKYYTATVYGECKNCKKLRVHGKSNTNDDGV